MILVAIDTSDRQGSVALAEGNSGESLKILDLVRLDGGLFSAQLVPKIASLLNLHKLQKSRVGAFAVNSGPGSFTGLRIGLAAVKGLAEAMQTPIVSVSKLQAVAMASALSGKVVAVTDAGRGEVYIGEYQVEKEVATKKHERVLLRSELLSQLEKYSSISLATTDQSFADAAEASGIPHRKIDSPQSDWIARIAWEKIKAGDLVSAEGLQANYVRSLTRSFIREVFRSAAKRNPKIF